MTTLHSMRFDDIYKNKRVFLTGLTGFKGTWFALWLQRLGATVLGYSNGIPGCLSDPKHIALLDMSGIDVRGDVRDDRRLKAVMRDLVWAGVNSLCVAAPAAAACCSAVTSAPL